MSLESLDRAGRKLRNQIDHAKAAVAFHRELLAGNSGTFYRTQKQRALAKAEARLAALEAIRRG